MSFEFKFTFLRLKKTPWIALLSTTDFEQVKKHNSHFANFEQVISHFAEFKQVIIILQILNKKFFFFVIYKKWNPQDKITVLMQ